MPHVLASSPHHLRFSVGVLASSVQGKSAGVCTGACIQLDANSLGSRIKTAVVLGNFSDASWNQARLITQLPRLMLGPLQHDYFNEME